MNPQEAAQVVDLLTVIAWGLAFIVAMLPFIVAMLLVMLLRRRK